MLGTDYPFPLGDLEAGKMIEKMSELTAAQKVNKYFVDFY